MCTHTHITLFLLAILVPTFSYHCLSDNVFLLKATCDVCMCLCMHVSVHVPGLLLAVQFNVNNSWGDFFHHISDEVVFVTKAVGILLN